MTQLKCESHNYANNFHCTPNGKVAIMLRVSTCDIEIRRKAFQSPGRKARFFKRKTLVIIT